MVHSYELHVKHSATLTSWQRTKYMQTTERATVSRNYSLRAGRRLFNFFADFLSKFWTFRAATKIASKKLYTT